MGDLHFQSAAYTPAMEYYRSALSDAQDPRVSSRIHAKISDCLRQQGMLEESEHELRKAFDFAQGLEPPEIALLDVRFAQLHWWRGEYKQAIEVARGAFATLATTDHHRAVAQAQIILGGSHMRLGSPHKAREFYEDALSSYRRIGHRQSQANVLNNLAVIAKNECRWDQAVRYLERAEKLLADHGSTYEVCVLRLNRAILFRKMGRLDEALAFARQGLEMARNVGDQGRTTRLKLLLGQIHVDAGRLSEAQKELLEARVLAERCGGQRELALADEFMGDLMAATGNHDQALANYDLAEERALQISESNDILAEVQRRRADVHLAREEVDLAEAAALRGLEIVDDCGEEFERPFLTRVLGRVALRRGDLEEADRQLSTSLDRFRRIRVNAEIATALHLLFECNLRRGGTESLLRARGHLLEALRLDSSIGSALRCRLHLGLARLEYRLENYEDALLALFEVERLHCESETGELGEVDQLRTEIERAMASRARHVSDQYREIVEPVEAFAETSQDLNAALCTLAERLRASRACVVLARGRTTEVLSCWSMPKTLARRLGGIALKAVTEEDRTGVPRVWTHAKSDAVWSGEDRVGDAVAVFAVGDPAVAQVAVYFDAVGDRESVAFGSDALAMASTHIHLWRESLLAEQLRPRSEAVRPNDAAFEHIITRSERVFEILQLCAKVAASPYTVLLTGETGTGKGLLAKTIHELSPRRKAPLVSVNCAAIPETLLESELFGHVRGSFTGADRDREGLIVAATSGTLFLDEVGKMSLPMQGKLLHFLDTKEVRPVGGSATTTVDVRVICASKRDLRKMVEEGLFLEDLFYRLLDFPIEVPPLRDRGDDVILLARHYAETCAAELGRSAPGLTKGLVARLRAHRWPGNVRELEKTIKRASILAADGARLREDHLPEGIRRGPSPQSVADTVAPGPLRDQVAALEARVVEETLQHTGWNRSEAARRLQISYPTLLQKIRTYDLHPL